MVLTSKRSEALGLLLAIAIVAGIFATGSSTRAGSSPAGNDGKQRNEARDSIIFLPAINKAPDLPTSSIFQLDVIDSNGPSDIWQKSVGDINGDGLPDLIAGGRNGGGLVWYQNPNWNKNTIASGGAYGTDGEVGDVDGDSDNDYISLTTSELRWYENPSWSFHTIDSINLHDIEIADFDQDGDLDIVGRNQAEFSSQGNSLHFYRQNSPTDWTHRTISIPNGEGLHVVDIDNDTLVDVVVNEVWLENPGDIINGNWSEHTYTSSWIHKDAFITSGDFNKDGRTDIVLTPAELDGQIYRISWFEAPPNPSVSNWNEHIIDNNVEAVHHFVGAADFNNDGLEDIATAEMKQGNNPDEVKVYFNVQSGQAWSKIVIDSGGSHSMRVVDIDNDGDADLYGANWQENDVKLWLNQTDPETNLGNWQRHVIDNNRPWQAVFIDTDDLNSDNLPDIITGGWWYQNPGSPSGSWTRHTIGSPLNNMASVFDFDQDGETDIVGTEGQGSNPNEDFVWARNDGSGNFTIFSNIDSGDGDFLQGTTVDVFENGGNNTIALSWHAAGKGIQTLALPDDPLTETWSWSQISPVSQDEALSSEDIDKDGDSDLLLGTKWLRNDGGSWTEFTINPTPGNPDRNRLVDIDKDTRLDAIVGFEAISTLGKLAWYEQPDDPTGTWTEHVIANIVGPMSLDVADMDGDGDWDVVAGEHNLANPSAARLYVFENLDGFGASWAAHTVYTGDEHHDGAHVTDIDNDGDLDIISIGWGHNRVLVYENLSVGSISQQNPTQGTAKPASSCPAKNQSTN